MKAEFSLILIGKRYGRFVRGFAMFFLLFTGADLVLPQYFCGEGEIGGVTLKVVTASDSGVTSADRALDLAAVATSDDSRPDQPSEQIPHEEDCFCCCAHVLPGLAIVTVNTSELRSPFAPAINHSFPSPPLRGAYRPPRIA